MHRLTDFPHRSANQSKRFHPVFAMVVYNKLEVVNKMTAVCELERVV